MTYTSGSEDLEVDHVVPLPGSDVTRTVFRTDGHLHAVIVSEADKEHLTDGGPQREALCGEIVHLRRIAWPQGAIDRCPECEQLSGVPPL